MKASGSDRVHAPQLLREHLALVLTGIVFVTVGLRVLAATRGDFSGALALLQNADPVEVVVGMGIQLLPLVPLVVAASMILMRATPDRFASHSEAQRAAVSVLSVGGVAVAAAALLVPNRVTALVGVGIGCVIVLATWGIRRTLGPGHQATGEEQPEKSEKIAHWSARGALIVTGAVYLVLALSPTMWLPREAIADGKEGALIGFVLSSDAERTVVLTSRSRQVIHIDTSTIRLREICVLEKRDRPLLFEVLGGDQPVYARCDEELRTRDG